MAKRSNGDKKSEPSQPSVPSISLLDAKEFLFYFEGQEYNVEDAPDGVFDSWIRQHVKVGWTLEDRIDAINTALRAGMTMGVQPLPEPEMAS